jgi:hypothetical protein
LLFRGGTMGLVEHKMAAKMWRWRRIGARNLASFATVRARSGITVQYPKDQIF